MVVVARNKIIKKNYYNNYKNNLLCQWSGYVRKNARKTAMTQNIIRNKRHAIHAGRSIPPSRYNAIHETDFLVQSIAAQIKPATIFHQGQYPAMIVQNGSLKS